MGLYKGKIDGIIGNGTKKAIKKAEQMGYKVEGNKLVKLNFISKSVEKIKGTNSVRYTNGSKCGIDGCAEFSNGELRKLGYIPYGNAWNIKNTDLIFSGYNKENYPSEYNLKNVEKYNSDAASNFKNYFDIDSLDKNEKYIVNMYYKGSPALEQAYNEGRDKMTGTHTGYVSFNPDKNRWEITHNIHGTVYIDPMLSILGANKKYGITGIFLPRKDNLINQVRNLIGV